MSKSRIQLTAICCAALTFAAARHSIGQSETVTFRSSLLSSAPPLHYVEGVLLVKTLSSTEDKRKVRDFAQNLHRSLGVTVVKEFRYSGWQLVQLPPKSTVQDGLKLYREAFTRNLSQYRSTTRKAADMILLVEPDRLVKIPDDEVDEDQPSHAPIPTMPPVEPMRRLPNDGKFPQMWNLENRGQQSGCVGHTGGRAGADISATEAWLTATGSRSVVVAVIDTGLKLDHPDIKDNLWINPNETPGNNLDDDNNGVVDDVHGFDAGSNDGDPSDRSGHGTHTAGTIGALGNNAVGVTGVNWAVSLMPIRIALSKADTHESRASVVMSAFEYVTTMKLEKGINVRVTSNSWVNIPCGSGGFDQAQKDQIDAAGEAGILNVFAAANASADNDRCPYYPASYDSASVISVAASNSVDEKPGFSNWGRNSVHIAAPGVFIWSCWIDGAFRCAAGTSMATPHVAGAAALLASVKPSISVAGLKAALLGSSDPLPLSWSNTPIRGGRLNLKKALQSIAAPEPPDPGPQPPGPQPSPPGDKIVFVSHRDGNREIYLMSPDGSGQTRLTNNSVADYSPALSPDGTKIVFVSERDGGNPELYIMKADGTEQRRLTNSVGIDEEPHWGGLPSANPPRPNPDPPTPGPNPPVPGNFRVSRYVTAELDDQRAAMILAEGVKLLTDADSPGDVSCSIQLTLDGSVSNFSTGDGSVDSGPEMAEVMGLPGNCKVVNEINFCGGLFSTGIVGCGGSSIVVERMQQQYESILWMHELGHVKGLPHRNEAGALMHGTIALDHRSVNRGECDAFQRQRSEIWVPELPVELAPSGKPGDAPRPALPIADFVRQQFIEGIPWDQASAYSKNDTATLLKMLADPRERAHWANIIATICFIGDAPSLDGLIGFIEKGEEQLSPNEYRAKRAGLIHLGNFIAKQGTQGAAVKAKALKYLVEGLKEEFWEKHIKWTIPSQSSTNARNQRLREFCIMGLANSGTPEALEALRALQRDSNLPLNTKNVLESALEVHAGINASGAVEYFRRQRHTH